jgi:hypothetical protein
VIERPNNLTYLFGDKKWTGKPAFLEAVKTDKALYDAILSEIYSQDKQGKFQAEDDKAAAELDSE